MINTVKITIVAAFTIICLTATGQAKTSFIINGQDITVPRPFFAYLEMYRQPGLVGGGYFGGGTLISQRAILTVAHNVHGFQSWQVGLGAATIAGLTQFGVESSHMHPDFNISSLANNIAVLRLDQQITPSPTIAWITRLPTGSQAPIPGAPAYVLGFGFGQTNVQPGVAQEARLIVLSEAECGSAYPHLSAIGQLQNHFCAQNLESRANICTGDQGGPIFSQETMQLFGVQSFNRVSDCGSPEAQPGGFIRVAPYNAFINQFL